MEEKTLRKQDKDVFAFSFFLAQTHKPEDTGRDRVTHRLTNFRHRERHRMAQTASLTHTHTIDLNIGIPITFL